MRFKDITVPEVYYDSWDFRFFLKWFWNCLTKVKYDTENLGDNYDPLKVKKELLWMLADTIGYRYDDRLSTSFNRLVVYHFMNMIRKKGSQVGVTFAAELNLAQFNLINYAEGYIEDKEGWISDDDNVTIDDDGNIINVDTGEIIEDVKYVEGKEILHNRLEDTSYPVNSVYVTPHTEHGYIEVVYFSTKKPIDACIEYVRPLGMYIFQHAGVRFDSRTQISIDARLTNTTEYVESLGPTHVGEYTREDYARMQMVEDFEDGENYQSVDNLRVNTNHGRNPVYYRNVSHEVDPDPKLNPGYRALYSLQLSNNEHIVKALIDPMFSLGYGPQKSSDSYSDEPYYITEDSVTVVNPKSYLLPPYRDQEPYNLRYDRNLELSLTEDLVTLDEDTDPGTKLRPKPAVGPIMSEVGDAISISDVLFSETSRDEHADQTHPEYLGRDEDE